MNMTIFFSRNRFFSMVIVFVLGLTLVACGGLLKKKEQPAEEQATEQKGSLSRIFTIVDGQGRKSGTLTLEVGGGAILRDESGKVIGEFKAISSEAEPSKAQPSEAQSKPEATETQSEPQQPEAQSKSETSEPDTKAKE